MTREEIADINPEAILYDGYDDAIIGMASRCGMTEVVAYDEEKFLEIMANSFELTEDDLDDYDISCGYTLEDKKQIMALENYEFNYLGAYLGDNTPIFIRLNL